MKIFHNTFRRDGKLYRQREITNISPENKARKEAYEARFLKEHPGAFFCLSMMAEEGDGENYENVPEWKVIAAAEIIQQAKNLEIARKLGKDVRETRH